MRRIHGFWTLVLTVGYLVGFAASASATPFASNVSVTGTTVNFILNEPSDTLTYSLNGGSPVALDGTTKGAKTFNLGAASDTFSIVAQKNAALGYTVPNGIQVPASALSSSLPANGAHRVIISDDANGLTRFNSPRGVHVSLNPNAPNFGTAYISNSADQTGTPFTGRTSLIGDGIYALRADQSDAYGFGDTAAQEANWELAATANSPFRPFVAADGSVYVAGFGDALSGLFRMPHDMSGFEQVFTGVSGPEAGLPPGQNHGSIAKAHVTGSPGGNLTVWTMDEDLTSTHVNGVPTPPTDRNSLWRYDIGNASFPYSTMPVRVAFPFTDAAVAVTGQNTDLAVPANGKFYMSDFRSTGTEDGVVVANPDGSISFNSLVATHAIDPLANDIYRNTFGIAVSPDEKWMATLFNNNQIAITPLINGIPDVANRLVVDTDSPVNTARGIAFDAAGNIHYVSSGQARYRVLAPGGNQKTTLAWNGTTYSFNVENIVAALLGDFDQDNDVDAADYVKWQDNNVANGGSGGALPNDNGAADQPARYTLWKANFGNTLPGASAGVGTNVPEPGALLLLVLGLAAVGTTRSRRN